MKLEKALLEDWMRRYYFAVDFDIGSSGVQDFSLAELRELLGFDLEELDEVVFHDSKTLGGDAVRQALADRWAEGDASRVMITHGSTEANFLIMTALLKTGDEVVVLEPFYQQLYAVAQAVGCRLRRWNLRWERGFRPDLGELEELITANTRMVVVNFPHNPTGTTLDRDELRELIALCAGVGAYLVWDGAFGELTYEAPPLPDPALSYERAISMGTLSKAFGLPGLRVGWCLAGPRVLERFVRLRDYTLLHLSPLVELIAERVFEQADVLLELRLAEARNHRELLASWIGKHQEWVEWVPPLGGVCAFPRLHVGLDVEAFCHRLACDHRVLLVPGVCFRQPQHVRLGFGGSRQGLEGGLDRLSACLAEELKLRSLEA